MTEAARHWAQNLIEQLPADHDGRNSWLINHGVGPSADAIRADWVERNGRPLPSAEIAVPQTIKTSRDVHIDGIAQIATKLPDDHWYEMTMRIRKIEGGAEVQINPKWERVP